MELKRNYFFLKKDGIIIPQILKVDKSMLLLIVRIIASLPIAPKKIVVDLLIIVGLIIGLLRLVGLIGAAWWLVGLVSVLGSLAGLVFDGPD